MLNKTFRNETLANVERFYNEADSPNFDLTPTLICRNGDSLAVYVLRGSESPADSAAQALKYHTNNNGEPDECAFVSAVWRRDPKSGERVGEGVFVVFETTGERETVYYSVERDPLRITRLNEATTGTHARVSLLYNERETTH